MLRDSTDLVRTLLSFNGLSNGKRTIRAGSMDERDRWEETQQLTVTQKGDVLTIKIPQLHLHCNQEDLNNVRQGVYERVANFLHSGDMSADLHSRGLLGGKDGPSPLGMITEAFEGVRAARKFGGEWRGARDALAEREAKRVAALQRFASEADDKQAGYIAAESLAGSLLADWSPELYANESKLEEVASPVLKNKLDALRSSGIIGELDKAQSYEQVRELANRAFELLYDKSAEEEEEQRKQEQKQDGEGEGEGDDSGMGDLSEATGRGSSKGAEGDDGEAGQGRGHSTEHTPPGEEYSIGADGTGGYVPTPDDKVLFRDYTKNPGLSAHGSSSFSPAVLENTTGLANAVRQAIQVRSQAYYVGAQRKGKIQRSNVYRIGVPTVGNGEWNARFRKQKVESNTLDTAVLLLVDYSGSMYGQKLEMATGCALAMSDVLNSLNVKYAVHGFTTTEHVGDYAGWHHHLVFKGFKTPLNKPLLTRHMGDASSILANNEDYKALDVATRMLLAEPASRHVMIVLSDGSPACRREGYQEPEIKRFVLENSKRVEYVGIGIKDRTVKDLYPDFVTINHVEDLPKVILSTIKAKLT